jgi:4-amino-4-deoxychorismate lyase
MASGPELLLYNGDLLPATGFALPLPNRGLFFNDGFFETMVWAETGLRYLPHQLHRMQRAAAALGLQLPATLATGSALSATLGQLAQVSQMPARLRLQLWRSGGGLYTPTTAICEWLLTSQPFTPLDSDIARADFAQTVQTQFSPVSFCKGPNALTYVRAAQERQQRHLDELLLLSAQGHIAEAVSSSVAWLAGGTVYTPAPEAGGVAGVRLAHLQTKALALGLSWRQGLYESSHLLAAEAVFTANIAGIRAIGQIAGVTFPSAAHPTLLRLRQADVANEKAPLR